jgi:hypothetical protein
MFNLYKKKHNVGKLTRYDHALLAIFEFRGVYFHCVLLVEKKMRWPLGGNFELPTLFITEPKLLETPIVLSTVGDFQVRPDSSVYTVAVILVDGIDKEIELIVIDKCVMNVDVLIGQNFTELDDIRCVNVVKRYSFQKFVQALTVIRLRN